MNIEKTIQYLQDIVDLETQRNIAYNTYQKLTTMEKQKAYANKVDVYYKKWRSCSAIVLCSSDRRIRLYRERRTKESA